MSGTLAGAQTRDLRAARRRAIVAAGSLFYVLVLCHQTGAQAVDEPTPTTTTVAAAVSPDAVDTGDSLVGVGGSGIDGMIPEIRIRRDTEAPTLLETFPPAAYTWDRDYGTLDAALKATDTMLIRPMLLVLIGWGLLVTRSIGWAFHGPRLAAGFIEQMFQLARSALWRPWGYIVLMVVGAWVGIQTMRARALAAVQHMGWTLALGAIGVATMWVPVQILDTVGRVVDGLGKGTMAVATLAPSVNLPDGTTIRGTYSGDPADAGVRAFQDTWWRLYIYMPWAVGEFGVVDPIPGQPVGERVLMLKSGGDALYTQAERDTIAQNLPVACPDGSTRKGYAGVSCQRSGAFGSYRDDVLEKVPGVGPWINGKTPEGRFAVLVLAGIAAAISGVFLIGVSIAMLWWFYESVFRFLLVPYYCLRGMIPPDGPQFFLEQMGKLAWAMIKRALALAGLALLLVTTSAAAGAAAQMGWAWMVVCEIVATIVVLWILHRERKRSGMRAWPRLRRRTRTTLEQAAQFAPLASTALTAWGMRGASGRHHHVTVTERIPVDRGIPRTTSRPDTPGAIPRTTTVRATYDQARTVELAPPRAGALPPADEPLGGARAAGRPGPRPTGPGSSPRELPAGPPSRVIDTTGRRTS